MAYPFYPTFRNLFINGTNTSSGGAEMTNIVPCRAKYVSTMVTIRSSGGGTSGFDVFGYQNALGGASTSSPTITIITSGQSVTTTTGNVTFEVGSTLTGPIVIFNKGDLIGISASTGVGNALGWAYTHTFQEF